MKIIDKIASLGKADEPYFSLEFFPPKTEMVYPESGGTLTSGPSEPPVSIKSYGTVQSPFRHGYVGRWRKYSFKIARACHLM